MPKVVLIGLDAAVPMLVRKYMSNGSLPNMSKIMAEGVWSQITPVFPTHTAANWNTVSTGAYPQTHGVTDMVVKLPGKQLTEVVSGFYSHLCKAEQLWNTAERHGLKVILMKYIGSWPPTISNGYQVEGFGAPGGPGSRPWGSSPLAIANSSCYCTYPLENATLVTFRKVSEVRQSTAGESSEGFETTISLGSGEAGWPKYTATISSTNGQHGSQALLQLTRTLDSLQPSRDHSISLRQGETSDWVFAEFSINGRIQTGYFRFTLVELAQGPELRFKLFVSQIFPNDGWTYPNELAKDLLANVGPFLESISHFPYVFGWIDEETYLADAKYQAKWIAKSTRYLMSKYPWQLYMTQWHGIDNTQHAFLRFDKSVLSAEESRICDTVTERAYQIADDLVGEVFSAAHAESAMNKATKPLNRSNGSDEVYTVIMSDHGHVMGKRRFFVNAYLYQHGLIRLKKDESTGKVKVDWSRTVAFAQGMVHLFINVKGREPEGCVEPGKEYDQMVARIISLLYDVKDPKTRTRPIALALGNKNAEVLGLGGDRSGDIVISADPVYVIDNRLKTTDDLFEDVRVKFPDGSIHGSQLPSTDLGEYGSTNAIFIAHGPRIKKGYRRESPIRMVDVAPTISHLLGIPAPLHSEGTIIHDIME